MTRHLFAVADTSVLLAVYNRKDDHHERAVQALSLVDRLVVSPMVLAELATTSPPESAGEPQSMLWPVCGPGEH